MKIVHAADFHLDSAFGALGPERARLRRQESRGILERLARYVSRTGTDVLLLSGDLFDAGQVYRETLESLAAAFAGLSARVFIAPGNHDCCDGRSAYARVDWPENVHIFRTAAVEGVELPEWNAVVYGAAFPASALDRSPLRGFAAPADGKLHLMTLHGEVTAGESQYGPLTEADIAQSGLDYLALGHVHRCSGLQRSGNTFWAYPGCPEGRGFDETGVKGILAGTVERGDARMEFVPFCRRKYEILSVDVTGEEPEAAIRRRLPPDAASDIYRILLTGETDERGLELARLRERLQDDFYELELRDETRMREDVWTRAGEDSLRGLLLRDMRRRLDAAENEERRHTVETALRFALAALDGRDI